MRLHNHKTSVSVDLLELRVLLSNSTSTTHPAVQPAVQTLQHSVAMLAGPAQSPVSTVVGNKSIFAGGRTDFYGGISKVVNIFDSFSDQWTSIANDHADAVGAVTVGNEVLLNTDHGRTQIEIYDSNINTFTAAALSQPRFGVASVSARNLAFFAGGSYLSRDQYTDSDVVDIYNGITGNWSVGHLSVPRKSITAIASDNLVFFAAGDSSGDSPAVVDIYNLSTGQWSVGHLSSGTTTNIAAEVVGNKVIFAGGEGRDVADVYDTQSGIWTTARLSEFGGHASAVVGTEAIFTSGGNPSGAPNIADIYNAVTNRWSKSVPPGSVAIENAAAVGNNAIFASNSDNAAVFNARTQSWSTIPFSNRRQSFGAVALGTRAIFAGGTGSSSTTASAAVDIYTDTEPSFSLNGRVERVGENSVAVTMNNIGDASLPAGYSINIYASNGHRIGGRMAVLGRTSISSPAVAGSSTRVSIPIESPPDGLTALVAAAVPPGRGHAVLFASMLDAFSVRRVAPAAVKEIEPSATPLISPGVFSMQPMHTLEPVDSHSRRDVPDVLA